MARILSKQFYFKMEDIKLGGVDTSQAQTSLKALRETIKAAKNEMLNLEEGTNEYREALTRAANAQFQMAEINEQVRATAMDLGAVLNNSTRVLQGLAGGYTAFQGISNLLGVENKNLQETFVKLQAAMAVVQGLDGIDGMFKSLKNLSIIMKQTETGTKILTAVQKAWNYVVSMNPIFLLVTALAAVTAGVLLFTKAMRDNNSEIAESNRLLDANRNYQNLLAEDMEYNAKLASALGKSQIEILRERLKAQQELDAVNEQEIERLFKKIYVEQEATDEEKKRYDELLEKRKEYSNKIKQINDEITFTDLSNRKKVQDDYVANNQKIEEEQRKHNEKLLADAEKFNNDMVDNIHQRGMDALDAEMQENEKYLQANYEWNLNKQTRQLESDQRFREYNRQLMEENYLAMDELDRAAFLNKQTTEFEFAQSTLQNRIDFNNKLLEDTTLSELDRLQIENDNAEARKQIAENEAKAKEQLLNGLNGVLQNASNIFGKETAVGKSIAVASATIATYQSATQAYNSLAGIPVVGPGLGAVAAGVAIASGLKNVKEILKVKVPKAGSGGGSSAISAPSISAPKIPSTLTAVRNVQTESEVSLQKEPIRAYVVESDISKTSDRINTIKKESEF